MGKAILLMLLMTISSGCAFLDKPHLCDVGEGMPYHDVQFIMRNYHPKTDYAWDKMIETYDIGNKYVVISYDTKIEEVTYNIERYVVSGIEYKPKKWKKED